MAITADRSGVLDFLMSRRNITRGSLSEKVYSKTQDECAVFQISKSLEYFQKRLVPLLLCTLVADQGLHRQLQSEEQEKAPAPNTQATDSIDKKVVKIVDFSKLPKGSSTAFTPEKVNGVLPPDQSCCCLDYSNL